MISAFIAGLLTGCLVGGWVAWQLGYRPDPYDPIHDPEEMHLSRLAGRIREYDLDNLPNGHALEDYRRYRASIDAYLSNRDYLKHKGGTGNA